MIKLFINIQSFSDIITNSSSELFAVIESEKFLDRIKSLFDMLIPNQDSDLTPVIRIFNDCKDDWHHKPELDIKSDRWIEINLPYHQESYTIFFKTGMEAILDQKFGKENYIIKYA